MPLPPPSPRQACPLKPVELKMGRVCVYNTSAEDVIATMLGLFDKALPSLQNIEQVGCGPAAPRAWAAPPPYFFFPWCTVCMPEAVLPRDCSIFNLPLLLVE